MKEIFIKDKGKDKDFFFLAKKDSTVLPATSREFDESMETKARFV